MKNVERVFARLFLAGVVIVIIAFVMDEKTAPYVAAIVFAGIILLDIPNQRAG